MQNQVQTPSYSSNKEYNITNKNNSRNSILNFNSISDKENRNINISNSANNRIVTNTIVSRSIGENSVNIISKFLNHDYVNIL